jgi:hypothetical protein
MDSYIADSLEGVHDTVHMLIVGEFICLNLAYAHCKRWHRVEMDRWLVVNVCSP